MKTKNGPNFFGSFWGTINDPDFPEFYVEKNGKIVFQETRDGDYDEDDDWDNNLDYLIATVELPADRTSICDLMKYLKDANFLVGPSTHVYYNSTKVRSSDFKYRALELYHPDIVKGFQPSANTGSMRPF